MAAINLRKFHATAVTRMCDQLAGGKYGEYTCSDYEQLEVSANKHYERVLANQELLVGEAKEDELEAHLEWWDLWEPAYIQLRGHLTELRMAATPKVERSEGAQVDSAVELKLEPLGIPTFDGSLHKWLAFKDTFETVVHRRDLPDVYKLAKLRQAVPVSAVPLIGSLYSGGYHEVWQALKERYDNRKQLSEIHVSRFLNMPPASEETAKSLLDLVDQTNESLRALRVMQLPVDSWDALTVPIVVSKLPRVTQCAWCMHCSPTELSCLADLLKFLEKRSNSLTSQLPDTADLRVRREPQRRAAIPAVKCNVSAATDGQCQHCWGQHKVMRCPVLLALQPGKRFEAIRGSNLCYNCLRSGHSSNKCASGGCRQCGRKHHTILCQQPPQQASTLAPMNTTPTVARPTPGSSSVAPATL